MDVYEILQIIQWFTWFEHGTVNLEYDNTLTKRHVSNAHVMRIYLFKFSSYSDYRKKISKTNTMLIEWIMIERKISTADYCTFVDSHMSTSEGRCVAANDREMAVQAFEHILYFKEIHWFLDVSMAHVMPVWVLIFAADDAAASAIPTIAACSTYMLCSVVCVTSLREEN